MTPPKIPHANCAECPRLSRDFCPPEVSRNATHAHVGQDPGKDEIRLQRPFIGRTGQWLWGLILELLGAPGRVDTHVTNACLCIPPQHEPEKETNQAIKCCRPRLLEELKTNLAPDAHILTMGKTANVSLMGHNRAAAQGYHRRLRIGRKRFWVIPTVHPSWVMRSGLESERLRFTSHLEGFYKRGVGKLADGAQGRIRVNPSWARVRREMLKPTLVNFAHPAIACDLETTGLLPSETGIKAISISDGITAWVWKWPVNKRVFAGLKELLQERRTIWQNGVYFDIPILERHGLPVPSRVEDTRDAQRAINSSSPLNLAFLGSAYLQVEPWKDDIAGEGSEQKGVADVTVPMRKLLPYCGRDSLYTHQVWQAQKRLLKADSYIAGMYAHQLQLAKIASRMSFKGFPIDAKKRVTLGKQLRRLFKARVRKIRKLVKGIRISDAQVNDYDLRALLFGSKWSPNKDMRVRVDGKLVSSFNLHPGWDKDAWTPTGLPAVNQNALLAFLAKQGTPDEVKAIVREVWRANGATKALGTFVEGEALSKGLGRDGWVHASWNSARATTGRWGCSNPNLMNLSAAKKASEGALQGDLPNVRAMYVAPKGYVLVHRDYSQLELRLIAIISGDETMLRWYAEGLDVHTESALHWFKGILPPGGHVPSAIRRQAKVCRFASNYGAGPKVMYREFLRQMGDQRVDYSWVVELRKLFHRTHPGILSYWQSELDYVGAYGYSETRVLRRKRYFPDPQLSEVVNHPIQGTAGDIMNLALIKLHPMLPSDAWICAQGHDAATVICKRKDAPDVSAIMAEAMEGPWEISGVPHVLPTDGKIGRRWSEV